MGVVRSSYAKMLARRIVRSKVGTHRKPTMTVLIVDSHAYVRERLAALVAEIAGVHAVVEAESEARARAWILENCPEVIVLDLRMAGSRGGSLVAQFRRSCPSATLVALSTEPSRWLERAYTELGADHVFDKSKDLPSLQAAIESAAEKALR